MLAPFQSLGVVISCTKKHAILHQSTQPTPTSCLSFSPFSHSPHGRRRRVTLLLVSCIDPIHSLLHLSLIYHSRYQQSLLYFIYASPPFRESPRNHSSQYILIGPVMSNCTSSLCAMRNTSWRRWTTIVVVLLSFLHLPLAASQANTQQQNQFRVQPFRPSNYWVPSPDIVAYYVLELELQQGQALSAGFVQALRSGFQINGLYGAYGNTALNSTDGGKCAWLKDPLSRTSSTRAVAGRRRLDPWADRVGVQVSCLPPPCKWARKPTRWWSTPAAAIPGSPRRASSAPSPAPATFGRNQPAASGPFTPPREPSKPSRTSTFTLITATASH